MAIIHKLVYVSILKRHSGLRIAVAIRHILSDIDIHVFHFELQTVVALTNELSDITYLGSSPALGA